MDDILKYFSYFPREKDEIFHAVFSGDNLCEMSDPIFQKKKKLEKHPSVFSSAEFAHNKTISMKERKYLFCESMSAFTVFFNQI